MISKLCLLIYRKKELEFKAKRHHQITDAAFLYSKGVGFVIQGIRHLYCIVEEMRIRQIDKHAFVSIAQTARYKKSVCF